MNSNTHARRFHRIYISTTPDLRAIESDNAIKLMPRLKAQRGRKFSPSPCLLGEVEDQPATVFQFAAICSAPRSDRAKIV